MTQVYYGKEIPVETHQLEKALSKHKTSKPDSFMQALMESYPLEEPEISSEDIDVIKESILEAIDTLSEQDRFIVNAINYEGLTYVELGERMGISNAHAWRLKQAAYKRLQALLEQNTHIQQKVNL